MMRTHRLIVAFGGLALAAGMLAACAPLSVRTYADRRAQFADYRTYGWALTGSAYTGDPRLDANPFFHEYVKASIEEHLAARGIEPAAAAMPQLLVRYAASSRQEIYTTQGRGVSPCPDCSVELFEEGTLVIDLVDSRTNRLLWRGWAEGSLDGVVDDQQWMQQRIDDAVRRIMARLPAQLGRGVPLT